MAQKININSGYCMRNYQWVIGIFDGKGGLVHIALNEKSIPDKFKAERYVRRTLFTSYGDPF